MGEIKRYDPGASDFFEWKDGSFVLYTDHQAALSAAQERVKELEARLSAMNALDPDGNWPSFGELALMFSEKCNEANALRKERDEAREAVDLMIDFIPEGWGVPLGWNQVVAQAQEAFGGQP